MGSKNEYRVKKLEQKFNIKENPVTEITVNYIEMDGSVSSSRVKKLINGVWSEWTEGEKSTN